MLSSRASRCLSPSNLSRITRSSVSSQKRVITSFLTNEDKICSRLKMSNILPENKPNTSLWSRNFSTVSNKGSITSKTGLSCPQLFLSKFEFSTFYGMVASSSNPQDTQSGISLVFFKELYFVNRLESMRLALNVCAVNALQRANKCTLLVAPQMFGSGKTTFFQRFCAGKITPDNPNGNPYYEELLSLKNIESKIVDKSVLESHYNVYKSVLDSQYVLVNLHPVKALSTDLDGDLMTELSDIFELRFNCRLTEEERRISKYLERRVMILQKKLNRPIFLHFDEIEEIEFKKYDSWFSTDQDYVKLEKEFGHGSLEARLYRYYQLWKVVYPLLTLPNVFVAFSGKSEAAGLLNTGQLTKILPDLKITSPGDVQYLFFDPLGVKHVREIVRNHTPLEGSLTRLNEDLGLEDKQLDYGKLLEDLELNPHDNKLEDLDPKTLERVADQLTLFCYALRDFSGGIPRFISLTLSFVWSNRATLNLSQLKKLEEMEKIFHNQNLLKALVGVTPSAPFEGLLNSPGLIQDHSLSRIHNIVLGSSFHEDEKIAFKNSDKEISIVSFLTRYNCHTSKVTNEPGKLQAVIPGWLRERVYYNFILPSLTLQGANNLCSTGVGYEKVIGFGFLHSLVLLSRDINSKKTLSQTSKFPTSIEQELTKLLTIPSSSPASEESKAVTSSTSKNSLLPLVVIESQKLTERTILISHNSEGENKIAFNSRDLHSYLADKFNKNKKGNTIFIWFQPLSQSPDVLIAIKKHGVDQVESSNDYFLIGIATKCYKLSTNDGFTTSKLPKEIKKWRQLLLPDRTTPSLLFCYSNRFYTTNPEITAVPLDQFYPLPSLPPSSTSDDNIKETSKKKKKGNLTSDDHSKSTTKKKKKADLTSNDNSEATTEKIKKADLTSGRDKYAKYICSSDHSFLGHRVSTLIEVYAKTKKSRK